MAARDDYDTALVAVVTALTATDFVTARNQLNIARIHAMRIPEAASSEGLSMKERDIAKLDKVEAALDAAEARASKSLTISRWVP